MRVKSPFGKNDNKPFGRLRIPGGCYIWFIQIDRLVLRAEGEEAAMAVSIDLKGKRGVIWGVANQRSIAWAISQRLAKAGAELAFTYLNERLKAPIEKATADLDNPMLIE